MKLTSIVTTPLTVFFFFRCGAFAVQREADVRKNVRTLIGRALIDDAAAVGLPGQRFTVEGEMAADVFNILQHRAIREHIQRVTVFKVNVVQQGLHLTVVIDNHINALVLGRIGAGRAATATQSAVSSATACFFIGFPSFLSV